MGVYIRFSIHMCCSALTYADSFSCLCVLDQPCFLVHQSQFYRSGSNAGPALTDAGLFWTVLMIFSFFLQAADTIVKEVIFLNGTEKLKGGSVDLFVVNSFGSAYQALFICLLLPFLSKLWGIPFYQLPSYLKDGAACFLNINNLSAGCSGAPLLPVLFVIVNMGFNISLLHLLKISSAVVSCLASTVSVPLSVFVFTLPLPYLGPGTALPPGFVAGVVILVLGLIFYARRPALVPATAPGEDSSGIVLEYSKLDVVFERRWWNAWLAEKGEWYHWYADLS
ncbi:hypothetical protein KSS87_018447 [Heliosperma pusillum]|nr:hypothetical protein KSS87_018447 [Heliosperma pusillum]